VAASQQQTEALLPLVTSLVSEKFSFYHVGIFLIDENREYAVLQAANSPGGKRMLERQHKLKIGQVGIVGNVAETGKARIALDVGQDAVYFDNPDLPETRSEAALPLQIGNEIIGVLDVQSTEANAFSEENLKTLSILADQIAIAIHNSRLVTDLQRALLEAQALQRQYLAQSWKSLATRKYLGYHKTIGGGRPVNQTVQRAEIMQALASGKFVTIYPKGSKAKENEETPALAIPIRLREQVIGVLNIRSQDPNRRWDDDEIALLSSISDRLALALENARLFEETTRRALRERTVSEITTKIRSKTDPESMIQTALAELRQVLGASHVEILPYAPPPETQTREKGK
jgi:GAF domain-containing protein